MTNNSLPRIERLRELIQESKELQLSRKKGFLKEVKSRADETLDKVGANRWNAWRWLVREYWETNDQLRNLEKAASLVSEVQSLKRKNEKSKDEKNSGKEIENEINNFLACFNSFYQEKKLLDKRGKKPSDKIESLGEFINCRIAYWKKVKKELLKAKPRVSVSHAFVMLSQVSGIEITALLGGGLILLGGFYMTALYYGAISQSTWAYWTLEDLINHGILVLAYVAATMILIELIAWIARLWFLRTDRAEHSYKMHLYILRHQWWLAVGVFVLTIVVASSGGYLRGRWKLAEFMSLTPDTVQAATVMDETILKNVYLVGTTSRTATFLQVTKWGTLEHVNSEPKDCRLDTRDKSEPHDANSVNFQCVADHQVLIIDRALIVCHATGKACLEQKLRSEMTAQDAARASEESNPRS